MIANDRYPDGASHTRGFVLVGVVMLVLALTILGLSLFSLSSYEAQFMNRSLDTEQALQFAMGGLARSRFALTVSPQNLSNVKLNLPPEIIYARASQSKGGPTPDTMGSVDWGGDSLVIRVTALHRNIQRTVEASYRPLQTANYYKRLLTVADPTLPIKVNEFDVNGINRRGTISMPDSVWQRGTDLEWRDYVKIPKPPVLTGGSIPVPDAGDFINDHAGASSPLISGEDYRLEASTNGELRYWYSGTPSTYFTIWDQASTAPTIWVRGRAVWCVKKGVRFENLVSIRRSGGDPEACLVIVAQNGNDDLTPANFGAVWFFGGLTSEIPVILVSDGSVKLEHFNAPTSTSLVPSLSVFARQVLLMGPIQGSAGSMTLRYDPGLMEGSNGQLDFLMSQGALPNASASGANALRLSAGTWRIVQ